jgi:hypothetical protein
MLLMTMLMMIQPTSPNQSTRTKTTRGCGAVGGRGAARVTGWRKKLSVVGGQQHFWVRGPLVVAPPQWLLMLAVEAERGPRRRWRPRALLQGR